MMRNVSNIGGVAFQGALRGLQQLGNLAGRVVTQISVKIGIIEKSDSTGTKALSKQEKVSSSLTQRGVERRESSDIRGIHPRDPIAAMEQGLKGVSEEVLSQKSGDPIAMAEKERELEKAVSQANVPNTIPQSGKKERKPWNEKLQNNRIAALNQQKSETIESKRGRKAPLNEQKSGTIEGKPLEQNAFEFVRPGTGKGQNWELKSETKTIRDLDVGFSCSKGIGGKGMQDAHLGEALGFTVDGKGYEAALVGVFDGHGKGGDQAANFVKDKISETLKGELEKNEGELTEDKICDALCSAFEKLDKEYEQTPDRIKLGGTTALLMFNIGEKVYFANLGDSRAIAVTKENTVIQLTEDAKVSEQSPTRFNKTVEKRGGAVWGDNVVTLGDGHGGTVGTARAIGDYDGGADAEGRKVVSGRPKITSFDKKDLDSVMLFCDGVPEVLTTNEVGEQIIKNKGDSPEEMAKNTVYSSMAWGSTDNLTCGFVKF